MRNILSVAIIIVLLTLVGGCQSKPISSSYALMNSSPLNPSNTVPSSIEERYAISDSDAIDGWDELKAKAFLNEMTYYKGHKVLTQMTEDRMVDYTIAFPDSWTLSYTVFNKDNNQKKAGELFPVFLLEPNDESEFLEFKIPEEYTESELVSEEKVTFGEYTGYKIILELTTSETWYPHTYYLTDGTYVFGISLYSYNVNRDEDEQKLFDDIVSTFRFKSTEL